MSLKDLKSRTVAVCVLGMHRSGTSALTRLINLLGVYLGDDLIPSRIDNPKGFWEHQAILDVHEKLLDALGSSFDDILSLPPDWHLSPKVKPFRGQLTEIVRSQLIQYGKLWGFKDPRVCRLVPMWREIFDAVGADARYILAIRNPEEIARSLESRDGYSLNKSLLLTLTHLLEAEIGTRGCPRVVVSYKSLMEDWQAVAGKIGDALQLAWPRSPAKIAPQVAKFLDPDLRHHAIQTPLLSSSAMASADPDVLRWMARLHEMFLAAENDPKQIDSSLVDEIRQEFEAERPRLNAWKAQRSMIRQNVILEQWGANLDRTLREMREENNWLKLALARLDFDPPQVLAAIKAQASAYPNDGALPPDLAEAAENILDMNRELQRRQAIIDRLDSDMGNLRSWTVELEKARDWMIREQAAIKQEVDLRDQHIQEIESWAQELDSGRRWQAEQIESLKLELARREEQITQLRQGFKEQETGKNWLAAQRDYFKTEHERLRKWTEELDSGRHWQAGQIDALKAELARRAQQIELLQRGFHEQETGRNWLAAQCDYFKTEHERMRKWVEELDSSRRWLESEREKMAAFLAQTQAGAADAQAQAQALLGQVLQRDATIEKLQGWANELDQSRHWLNEQIAGTQAEIVNRDNTLAELKTWVAELERAKVWLVEQRESLQTKLLRREKKSADQPQADSLSSEPETTGS